MPKDQDPSINLFSQIKLGFPLPSTTTCESTPQLAQTTTDNNKPKSNNQPKVQLHDFQQIQHDIIFMQYKRTTTCLSIPEVLKRNKEIPTSNVEPKEKKSKTRKCSKS